jgi:biopolymer transport protein TolR
MAMTMEGQEGRVILALNVTPLVDILLVLLIIFMVITPLTPKGLAALAPQAKSGGDSYAVIVSIDANKQVAINQQPVAVSGLGQRLIDIFKTRNERIVFVKGDPSLPFADVARIVDIAKGADIDRVGLITHSTTQEK